MVTVAGSFIMIEVPIVASIEYIFGFPVEMTKLVCCVDAPFLGGRLCVSHPGWV